MWLGDRLGVGDATMYWIGRRMPTDQFAVYSFDAPLSSAAVRARVAERISIDSDLRVRLWDVPGDLDYPYWVPREFGDDQIEIHRETAYHAVLARLAVLVSESLDLHVSPWRLHVFPTVTDLPKVPGPTRPGINGLVVLQVSHALRDGRGVSALARVLLDPSARVAEKAVDSSPVLDSVPAGVRAGVAAIRATSLGAVRWAGAMVAERTGGGSEPHPTTDSPATPGDPIPETPAIPQAPAPRPSGFAPTSLNVDPGAGRRLRIIPADHDRLRRFGPTVTVGALVVIGEALRDLLLERGDRIEQVAAEVTVAVEAADPAARNRYRNVGIDLRLERPLEERAAPIAADLLAARTARPASATPAEVPPAWQRAREVREFPLHMRPDRMTGNTVISSVDRGPADLDISGSRAFRSVGFPALSPAMALTHGVYGLGSSVTIGICAGDAAIDEPTLDRYADAIRALLD
ncbi:hypothetical protein [Millisia brevis]|uniref:hypothetical protein n=1 Tax=Millisia brevis TaxID=264148 RepID=UPI0008314877|nr:hypothetical protein [Millisia brevis]